MRLTHAATLSPIGLDIGNCCIKAVQLRGNTIQAALSLPRQTPGGLPDQAELQRLDSVLERRGFMGRRVVVSIPAEILLTTYMELPPASSGAPREQIARMEMARSHRLEPDHLESVTWALPATSGRESGTPVMVAGCQHDRAAELLDPLEAVGLEVVGMDLAGWAVARVCQPLFDAPDRMLAVAEIGWKNTVFMLIHQEALLYERVLGGSGLESAVSAITRREAIPEQTVRRLLYEPAEGGAVAAGLRSHVQTLGKELQLSLAYAEHQYPKAAVERVLLSGGGAGIPGLAEQLSASLEMPTEELGPETVCEGLMPDELAGGRYALTLAAGLALYPQEQMV